MSESLPFPSAESYIAFTIKSTYKFRITYDLEITEMHTLICLLDTEAGVNLIKLSLIPPS